MSFKRANINGAAKQIAEALGFTLGKRREDESDKSVGFLNVEWQMLKAGGVAGYVRLDCRSGWDAEGKSWAGHVSVLVVPDDENLPMLDLALGGSRLVEPFGSRIGPVACKKTRHEFVRWATRFAKERTEQNRNSSRKTSWIK
ncbi:hypothetical protein [Stutzerimonas stutzeri]|uniref:hypothetical protein n=1 Tax=Stutzerimonas stutzeri TaxID=316 RepID=UPI0015E37CB4|nr:hypothetical protein [Stutzerimonas stutzeri]MBA1280279.1 hypothetical protein [Stutzerimonas stutzeri]